MIGEEPDVEVLMVVDVDWIPGGGGGCRQGTTIGREVSPQKRKY